MTRYREFHRRSIEAPEDFWRDEARRIHWETPLESAVCALVRRRPDQPVP
jgi:propionyl-CoA synthetase